jgi:hypothetical protein
VKGSKKEKERLERICRAHSAGAIQHLNNVPMPHSETLFTGIVVNYYLQ